MTWDEYLTFEESTELRHEFHNGQIVAMVGVTIAHARLAGKLYAALLAHLQAQPCQPFIADVKLRIEAANRGLYPDVFVSCAELDPRDTFVGDATLIIEVLSESTEAYDRGDKFTLYKQLASFVEYVLIDTKAVSIDFFRKNEEGGWTWPARLGPGDVLELQSVGLRVDVDEIYRGSGVGTAPSSQASSDSTRP